MKAKRRGRLVHTIKGLGARMPASQPVPVDLNDTAPVDVTGKEISVLIPRAAPIPKPERVCPHGGIYLGGLAICGECEQTNVDDLFGLAVLYIAGIAARKVRVVTSTIDDCTMVAIMALIEPKNRARILKAKEPDALAMTIAQRAIMRAYRRITPTLVSQMSFPGDNTNKELETSERLEVLDAETEIQKEKQAWANAYYQRAHVFPGIGLLWTAANLNRLQIILDEAKRALPTKPFSVWMVINMRLGLGEDMREHSWQEITENVPPAWKNITERQVRYAYQEGLKSIKAHLINSRCPIKK